MSDSGIDPPEDVPERVLRAIETSSDRQLREIVSYARRLLQEHPPLIDEIEAREGEKLVRIDDDGDYTSVIVERPNAIGEAGGPYAYRVRWVPTVDGEGGKYRWHYLGRVNLDPGGA